MKRSVVLSLKWVQEIAPLAQRAEAAGLYRVWTTEYNSYDAIVRAALIAAQTDRIQIGTGITYAFTRRPVALAAAASDVQVASNGRFTLGLGTGTNGMRKKWFDLDFDAPSKRLAEIVTLLRTAAAANNGLHFDGAYERTSIPGYSLPDPGLAQRMEIWGSGVNKIMLTAAARSCDGVAVHPLTISADYWEDAVEGAVAKVLDEDGRRAKIAAWVITSVHDDEEKARWQARCNLAFYFSTPSYQSASRGAAWEPAAAAILAKAQAEGTHDIDGLARLVPDDMVDDLTISGTPEQVRVRTGLMEKELAGRGVEEIVFQLAARGSTRAEAVASCAAIIDVAGQTPVHA